MKKTQFALAALALVASTAAFANGATVYGTIDASVTKSSNDQTAFDGSGNWAGSIFGFTGSEDIEGGLKANYTLEMGLNAGTGRRANGGTVINDALSSSFANRQANVGLSGEFGSVKAGLQLSPYIASVVGTGVTTNNESFYVPMLAMSGSVAGTFDPSSLVTTTTGGFFIPNSVSYSTPSIGGFSASALKQFNGAAIASTTAAATKDRADYSAYTAGFSAGDVRVGLAYEDANRNVISETALGQSKNTAVTAGYTMGAVNLAAAYINHKDVATNTSFNTYSLSGATDVSEKVQLSLNYAKNSKTLAQSRTVAGAQYRLSKSTALYATAGRGTNGLTPLYSGSSNTTGDVTAYAVGMYKSF
jgi:predicted porin